MGIKNNIKSVLGAFLLCSLFSCQGSTYSEHDVADIVEATQPQQKPEGVGYTNRSCAHANNGQFTQVNLGLSKLDYFLNRCYSETNSKAWCDQVARPNPDSRPTFNCTYSPQQPHFLIHPDENTWAHAIQAVKLVQEMVSLGIGVEVIYNWWRPEPYNANVGGAAGRHPYGTSVDVRFKNKAEQNRAHQKLCEWRSHGRLRALGYYPGTGLHLGVGDTQANTWGKGCPSGFNTL